MGIQHNEHRRCAHAGTIADGERNRPSRRKWSTEKVKTVRLVPPPTLAAITQLKSVFGTAEIFFHSQRKRSPPKYTGEPDQRSRMLRIPGFTRAGIVAVSLNAHHCG